MEEVIVTGSGLDSLRDQSSCALPALQCDSICAMAPLEYETWRAPPTLQHKSMQDLATPCSALLSPFRPEISTSPSPHVPVSQSLDAKPITRQIMAANCPATTVAASADSNAILQGEFEAATATESGGAQAAAAAVRPKILGARVTTCFASFILGIPVDLANLAQAIPNAVGKTHGRGCLCFHRLRKPTWKAAVSPSGFVRMFTAYDGEHARTAAKQFARLAKKYYSSDVAFKKYKILNVHIHAKIAFALDLDGLAAKLMTEQKSVNPMVPRLRLIAREHDSLKIMVEGVSEGDRKITVLVKQHGFLMAPDAKALKEGTCAFDALLPHLTRHSTWW